MTWEILLQTPLFTGLTQTEIQTFLSSTGYKLRKYSAGSMIAQSGEKVNEFLIVLSGTVKGEMVDFAGKVIKIEDIPAPGALASAFIFGKRNFFPVNVMAVTDCDIISISKASFLYLLKKDDRILVNFLDMISNRSQFLSEKIRFLNFRTIRGKLAQYILNLPGNSSGAVRLDRTQFDLADYFGVTRPSISRALSEMEHQGLIRADGKSVIISDRQGLLRLTSEK
jgi:CRP/FNR family transcriptional regulator, dissimilatory nitrate respiration regulator